MFKKKLVSIIILTWNRKEDILETIGKVKESYYPDLEIIAVDNGSNDGTGEALKKIHPDVKYLYLPKNIGIGGYNRGLEIASGEFIVFLDSDSYPAPQAVGRMVRVFQKQGDTGAVAFDVRNAHVEKLDKIKNSSDFDPSSGNEVSNYNGAGVGIRWECLQKAGGLFEPFFLYCNELDHSFRIRNSGYKIKHFSSIISYHKESPTGRTSTRAAYFYTRNLLWIIWRHFPMNKMPLTLFIFFYYAVIFSLCQQTTVYFQAIFDAFAQLPMICKNRTVVSKETVNNIRLPLKWGFMSLR